MFASAADLVEPPTRLRRTGNAVLAVLVYVLAFAGLAILMPRHVGMYDEGIVLTDAMRVAAGEIVHRDFYSTYGPAQFYIVAAVLKLSDGSFLAARIYDIACKALICALVFSIARRAAGNAVALLVAGAAGLWLVEFGTYPFYPIYPCIIFGLVATSLMVPASIGRGGLRAVAAAGVCSGAAALFRYDTGFLLLVSNLLGAVILTFLRASPSAATRRSVAIITAYALGTFLVFVPAAGAFLLTGAVGGFWHDIIAYPTKYYAAMRGLPFPRPWGRDAGGIYFTPVAAGLGLIEAGRMSWTARRNPPSVASAHIRALLILFSLCALFFFLKGLVRVSILHMFLGNAPALVVAAILARQWFGGSRVAQVAAALLVLLAIGPPAKFAEGELKIDIAKPDNVLASLLAKGAGAGDIASCQTTSRSTVAIYGSDYARVANYIARRTQPGERIVVALEHNDKIITNAMALYFAAGRLPGTHWSHFDPGLQNRADIQSAMIAELQANRVRWVVRDGSIEDSKEPNGSARSSGVRLLDDYLDATYRPVASAGRVAVWLLKTEAPPVISDPQACEAAPVS